ncbi:inactive protein RESTRICTED TEV MOVEMENT 2-like [Herrania umbratica]|uniref:Inactive protein RESTRICTED TEV MOVEMENT 2-like n=1 Tax=Herrania umbratica TaxID=108875 RepID=A0A6J1BBZ6_9ROSI|nr:inactive protein RESTRICTED TEV MOVEMENT 2-like [Herrania umbratica]
MRPRTTGVSTGARPQPPQNFRPKSEWKHEEAASFLFVYLPGFVGDQLTIKPDYSNRMVNVQGERRLPNNKILPVNETFSIPEDCNLAKMDKEFGRGILLLKMPRDVIPQQTPTKPQEAVGGWVTREGEDTTYPSKQTSTTGLEKQRPDKAAAIVPPVTTATDEGAVSTKPVDETSAKTGSTSDEQKLVENREGNEEESYKEQSQESAMSSATVADKVEEKEKDKSQKSGDAKGKEKENVQATLVSEKKGMGKELNEDRSLMINMGAAILIIAALGVSLFYNLIRS